MTDPRHLRSVIAQRREEFGVRKCEPLSWDEVCESRAASIYRAAVEATGSVRKVAKRADCDPKTVRDRQAEARGLYFKDLLKMPRAGLYEAAAELVKWADEQPEETGTDG